MTIKVEPKQMFSIIKSNIKHTTLVNRQIINKIEFFTKCIKEKRKEIIS